MSLTCRQCGTDIPLPPAQTRSPGIRLVCPSCGRQYRLRQRPTASTSSAPATPRSSSPTTPQTQPPPTTAAAPPSATAPNTARPAEAGIPPSTPERPTTNPLTPTTPLPGAFADLEHMTAGEHPTTPMRGPDLSPTNTPAVGLVAQRLEPDTLIAGRYRIVRFLAQGGMGEVYEAEDLELREAVALKTISPQAGGAEAIDRFKREIHLARKVTHPNVCRIFDLGQHQPAEGTGAGFFFLTMELLPGETLAARLRQNGRLSTSEALPVIEQMAAALSAAHRAGIVHRDFKSENIFLVENDGEQRVVVTDFGVARGSQGDRFAAQVTSTDIVGTPAYMAPEQVEGGEITAAVDLYALGVVIYEMVTGRLPFESDNPLTSAVKRLREDPRPPHVHVPDLEPRWEKVILRALARSPKERFASADELVEALNARPPQRPTTGSLIAAAVHPASAPMRSPRSSSRLKGLVAVLLLVVVASGGLFLWNQLRPERPRVVPRRSIAVLGFQNVAERSEVDWISTALAEMLGTELSRGEALRLIPGENVNRVRTELNLEQAGSYSPSTLEQIRDHLGCDFVVQGSYVSVPSAEGEQIRLDLRLQNAALGNTMATLDEQGLDTELFAMVKQLGQSLRTELGIGAEGELAKTDPGLPTDAEAARLYAEALDRLRDSRPLEARDLLQQAARLDPESPMLHYSLSTAWEALGYGTRAAEEAARAFELSARLSQEDRLVIEGRYHEANQDWQGAINAYQTLWDTFPDNVEYGLRLVETLISARLPDNALATVEELRQLPPPHDEDPRISLAEASAAGLANRYAQQLEAASEAAQRAQAVGARLLLARARLTESQGQRFFGRADQAQKAAEEAYAIYHELQHPIGSAQTLTALANSHFDRVDFSAAADAFRRSIELYRQVGDQGGIASTLNNLALVYKRQGDFASAMAHFEQAEAIFRDTGDEMGTTNAMNNQAVLLVSRDQLAEARPHFEEALVVWEKRQDKLGMAYALNNLAAVLHLQGELTQSRDLHRRALELRREIGHKSGETVSMTNLGSVLTDLGELAKAEELLLDGLDLARQIEDRAAEAQALYELGELHLMRGQLDLARASHQEALSLRRDLEDRQQTLASQTALARLELESDQPAEAEVKTQLALRQAVRDQQRLDEAHLRAILALALLDQGRLDGAVSEIEEAQRLAIAGERFAVQSWVALAAVRVGAATGEAALATTELEQLKNRAQRAGDLPLVFECMQTEAEIHAHQGELLEARRLSENLANEAGQQGFLLWQRKAEKWKS